MFMNTIGEGAYGIVWRGFDNKRKEHVAIKRFKSAHLDPEVMLITRREISILQSCNHPNIVKYLNAYKTNSGHVYLVTEFVQNTLTSQLRKHRNGFTSDQVLSITKQLLEAIQYMHASMLIHRDLKPSNILLEPNNQVKLCDFGFAREIETRDRVAYTSYMTTRWYRPPEIITGESYGPSIDIWSIGCLFAELATGAPMFPGRTNLDQLSLIENTLGKLDGSIEPMHTLEQRYDEFSPDMLQVLHACINLDPMKRLEADAILKLPYFMDASP